MISLSRIFLPVLGTTTIFSAFTALSRGAPETKVAPPVSAAPASTPGSVPFETFRTIADRNIFDPNRVSRIRAGRTEAAKPTGDSITLVGTMHYEKGYYAFFDSTDSKSRKVVHEGEPIAEYSVSHISASGVDLTRDGKTISLQVAQRLQRPPGEDWSVAAAELPLSDAMTKAGAPAENALPPIPADASDTLKRLMEQRRNQLKE